VVTHAGWIAWSTTSCELTGASSSWQRSTSDERADLAACFGVEGAPALVLLSDMVEVARLEGRQTLPSIRAALEPHFVTDELGMPELMLAGEPQLQAIGY